MTLSAKSAREIEVKGKVDEKTQWRGQNESRREDKRNGRLVGTAKTSQNLAQWQRL